MDESREIIRCLLDLLGICNLKKLKYQKLTSMSIFCIIEIVFISKETMGGLAHSSESNMSESYAIKHWQLSFCFYFSLNRLGKTSSRPVWDHPDASSKKVPELTSFVLPVSRFYFFPNLLSYIPDNIWTSWLHNVSYQSKKPNPTLFGALNATVVPSLKVR